jgi:leucyl-tRNA synthetase
MRRFACSFDWDRVFNTCDPEYYKWNQWLFTKLHERGLAYRKDSAVNWCPGCQTVLANEQVVAGLCERCDTAVTKKKLNQWYFKITDYADRLLDDMSELEGKWPEKVLMMQRNWIGRSQGANVQFVIEARTEPVTIYTTRPDTLYGATFMVVAADSALAAELAHGSDVEAEFTSYLEKIKAASDIDRLATDRPKSGVDLKRFAINPVNGEKLPIWASDYVLADYGTGAIMAVPAHDQRDLDFAKAMKLPVRVVVDTGEEDPSETGIATTGDGKIINSGALNGLSKADAIAAINSLKPLGGIDITSLANKIQVGCRKTPDFSEINTNIVSAVRDNEDFFVKYLYFLPWAVESNDVFYEKSVDLGIKLGLLTEVEKNVLKDSLSWNMLGCQPCMMYQNRIKKFCIDPFYLNER